MLACPYIEAAVSLCQIGSLLLALSKPASSGYYLRRQETVRKQEWKVKWRQRKI